LATARVLFDIHLQADRATTQLIFNLLITNNKKEVLMKVYVNDNAGGRKLVEAELIKEGEKRILVKLKDGNIIERKKSRDLPADN
jgi:translation elongation factor EF-4